MAKSKRDRLFEQVLALADRPVAPFDVARLSHAFAELPDPAKAVPRLIAELFDHRNADLRRIGIHACRRIGRFQSPGLRDALLHKFSDPDPWVRYDAAWAVKDAGYDGKDVRDALLVLAAGAKLPEDEQRLRENPSDARLAGQVQARQALDALLAAAPGQGQ
jgi:HEAT repeats